MNSISWLLYLAQVSTSLGYLFIALGAAGLLTVGGGCLVWCIGSDSSDDVMIASGKLVIRKFLPWAIVALFIGNVLPTKDTLYAIAASEIGERVVTSGPVKELANDAYAALHGWMQKQIEPPKK